LTTGECRQVFLDFFEQRGHLIRPSVSLISPDPTTLFTSAGMQPYMRAFRGQEDPPASRVASCQKCFRTSDIEFVGRTARHDTFFEMLGNFSFGDYFKQGAIDFAWELMIDVLKLPAELLWAAVYEQDDEAADLWHRRIGLPSDRVLRLGRGDNWWPKQRWEGPCGPCSELYVDRGPSFACDNPNCKPGCDGNELCDRYLEVWNLVFQMYTEAEDGTLTPLPKPGIDTGMGLERLALVMQPGARTIFETDEMRPILDYAFQLARQSDGSAPGGERWRYGEDAEADTAARIITDHVRAAAFLMADGAMPSNEGAGYILRRLIRRAYRFGRVLGLREPFLHKMVPLVGRTMGSTYPDLLEKQDVTVRILRREEARFEETLDHGMEMLERVLDSKARSGDAVLSGSDAFELYATYGFPLEMTTEIAAERGFTVDEAGFEAAMAEHVRVSSTMAGLRDHQEAPAAPHLPPTEFVGYRKLRCRANVVAILKDDQMVAEAGVGETVEVVLDRTPFYAERGGQVGDAGELKARGLQAKVLTTYPWRDTAIVHKTSIVRGVLRVGAAVTAHVDEARRRAIQRNHTATHLLHWALHRVLGEHALQSGSLVDADRLRFDFAHYEAPTREQLQQIEALVNEKVVANAPVKASEMSFDEAKREGAIALFGEKYGDEVRMLQVGDFSRGRHRVGADRQRGQRCGGDAAYGGRQRARRRGARAAGPRAAGRSVAQPELPAGRDPGAPGGAKGDAPRAAEADREASAGRHGRGRRVAGRGRAGSERRSARRRRGPR
jgi:alanyl-tRNA synthetase